MADKIVFEYSGLKIDTRHPDYDKFSNVWCRCRDVVTGEDAIKDRGTDYLPQLSAQSPEDYQIYKQRATFYNATARTVEGLVGAIFRRPPTIEASDGIKKLIDVRVGLNGAKFDVFGQKVTKEIFITNRAGILVDAANNLEGSARPYATIYEAENIINWRQEWVGDERVITMVVLEEKIDAPVINGEDYFEYQQRDLYRVLDLVQGDTGPIYRVRVFERTEGAREGKTMINFDQVGDTVYPTMKGGKNFDHIPFKILTEEGASCDINNPPIADLVSVNLSHYLNSADLEYGRHFTALPTPWAAGFKFEVGAELTIGPTKAWISDEPTAHAGMIEFTGKGLESLVTGIREKETQMAVLGARILQDNKKQAESADAVMLRNSGEQNTLMSIVTSVSQGLQWMLEQFALFLGETPKVTVELNKDFDSSGMPAGMLISLLQAVQNGAMSWDTFFWNMKRGEMYSPELTMEEEREKIEAGVPLAPPGNLEGNSGVPLPGGANRNANTALSGKK